MPTVCIQFPRQLYNLDFFCEETLYLACPEAARLFLAFAAGDRPFEFTVTEGNADYKVNTTNDDKKFLDHLLRSRDELIEMLESGISLTIWQYYITDRIRKMPASAKRPSPVHRTTTPGSITG